MQSQDFLTTVTSETRRSRDVGTIYNGASELKELLAELTIWLLTYSGRLVFVIFGSDVWIKGGWESLQLGNVCFGETPLRWADLEQGKIPAKQIGLEITSVDRSLTFESFCIFGTHSMHLMKSEIIVHPRPRQPTQPNSTENVQFACGRL